MKVSGFTFVKDAEKYDFPVIESIKSMLPLCDEVIINVGVSEDNTLNIIRSIDDRKIKIIETTWDKKFNVKSRILAQQTNIPLYKCSGDWCLYLQADEVLNEQDYEKIIACMEENLEDERVEGLLFKYNHLYGSYKTFINSYHWYRKEIRIIKNHLGIQSWRDAQGFRVDGKKLHVKECPAEIYHYGWVRDPYKMGNKKQYHASLHHGSKSPENVLNDRFYYEDHIDPYLIDEFKSVHPAVMKERIDDWQHNYDRERHNYKLTKKDIRHRITDVISRLTGIKVGEYRNYKLIKE